MSLKILGGDLRGLSLLSPPESLTRPTSTMLRRKIFDSHQDMSGHIFVDLCAGSGSIALEALSRGAEKVIMVEKNFQALTLLKKNAENAQKMLGKLSCVEVVKSDALKWMERFTVGDHDFQNYILFFDPPYIDKKLYEALITKVKESAFTGELWLESCRQKGEPPQYFEELLGTSFRKIYWQGTSYLGICSFSKD